MSQFYLSCDDELLDVYGEGILKKKFEMDLLKKVVREQTYNQKDPVKMYKLKSAEKVDKLTKTIREIIFENIFIL